MPYKLSATLSAHTSDVRAVAAPTNELVLSASRDMTAIAWQKSASTSSFTPEHTLKSTKYINCVAHLKGSDPTQKGYCVASGMDAIISVFSLDSPTDEANFALIGHGGNVCCLHTTDGGTIISGSWDNTAKVWKDFQLAYDLKGHTFAVWAVLALEEDRFLTGSADKTIKLWEQHKAVQTFSGHRDAVRGLALVPDIGFASCSNDSEIRVWTLGGDLIYTLSGHTSYVYSLSVLPNGDIVSGGEDRSVRVWKDGECDQIITHPAISVWSVATMPNGDIVSGCSDGVVRVFSASEERWASEQEVKEYDDKVAGQAVPSELVGDIKKSDLPGKEALDTPGKKPGDVKMIKDGSLVEVYEWDANESKWKKIGDVVDAVGQGRKQLYQGLEYDYVFDVDVKDGEPPLKLPYNVTDNPYSAAQKFLEKNDLPLTYLDEVVKFIEKNTAGVNLSTGPEEYVDPFTGASRYRSAGNNSAQAPGSSFVDPYTGASRYTASPATPQNTSSQGFSDPYTGSSRYSGAATSTPSTIPATKFVSAKQVKDVSAIQNKTYELDNALKHEISTSSLAMYPEESAAIDEIFIFLSHITSAPPETPPVSLTHSHIEAITQVMERWPSSQSFPLLDLSRLLVGYCPELFPSESIRTQFFSTLFKVAEWNVSWDAPLPKSRETNMLLVLRALSNVFQEGYALEPTWLGQIFAMLDQVPYPAIGKAQRGTYATLLYNISCIVVKQGLDSSLRDQHLALIIRVIQSEKTEVESTYRALVGLGNILYASKKKDALAPSQVELIKSSIASLSPTFTKDTRVQNITREILAM